MWIKQEYDYNDLRNNSWSGAERTLDRIEEANKEEELMNFLENIFNENMPTARELNDFLWVDDDYIYESLGILHNEDDEVDDDYIYESLDNEDNEDNEDDEDEVIEDEDEEVTPEDMNKLIK